MGLLVEVAGRRMKKDFEPVLECQKRRCKMGLEWNTWGRSSAADFIPGSMPSWTKSRWGGECAER